MSTRQDAEVPKKTCVSIVNRRHCGHTVTCYVMPADPREPAAPHTHTHQSTGPAPIFECVHYVVATRVSRTHSHTKQWKNASVESGYSTVLHRPRQSTTKPTCRHRWLGVAANMNSSTNNNIYLYIYTYNKSECIGGTSMITLTQHKFFGANQTTPPSTTTAARVQEQRHGVFQIKIREAHRAIYVPNSIRQYRPPTTLFLVYVQCSLMHRNAFFLFFFFTFFCSSSTTSNNDVSFYKHHWRNHHSRRWFFAAHLFLLLHIFFFFSFVFCCCFTNFFFVPRVVG